MKVLVTGASGFIGNYVIHSLLDLGYEVIASSTSIDKVKKATWFSKVVYIPFTIDDEKREEELYHYFNEPDSLIHLAWSGLNNFKALSHIENNLLPHYHFIKRLIARGLKQVTVVGTCLEYGLQEGALQEDLAVNPTTTYGIAKHTLWKFLGNLKKEYPFQLNWLRLFYMYGEGQSPKSILSQLDKSIANKAPVFNMSGGEQLRDYLPVELVGNIIAKVGVYEKEVGIVNACSGRAISIRRLVEEHLTKQNAEISLNLGYYPYPDYEPMAFWGDATKLNQILSSYE